MGHRVPSRMMLLWRVSFHPSLLLWNSQWWSQNWPTDRREPEARSGKTWAVRASYGSPGMFSCAVMLLFSVAPLGKVTKIGVFAVLWLEAGKFAQINCRVHPVSRIAGRIGGWGLLSEETRNSMCGEQEARVGKVLTKTSFPALSTIATVPAS